MISSFLLRANKTYIHMNGFVIGFGLKRRLIRGTRKWVLREGVEVCVQSLLLREGREGVKFCLIGSCSVWGGGWGGIFFTCFLNILLALLLFKSALHHFVVVVGLVLQTLIPFQLLYGTALKWRFLQFNLQ